MVMDPGIRVFIVLAPLGPEHVIPDAEPDAEVPVLMPLFNGMMHTVGLRGHEHIAQWPKVGLDVGMIEPGKPDVEDYKVGTGTRLG